jgi:hypothetical protein
MAQYSPQQVYDEVMAQGGNLEQAQVAAAFVSGIESDGDPLELSGGIGPAQGLFQFEPGTWDTAVANTGLPGTVAAASWTQQIAAYLNYTNKYGFGAWGPDISPVRGDPNSSSNPAYGYNGPIAPNSPVGKYLAGAGASLAMGEMSQADWAALQAAGAAGGTAYLESLFQQSVTQNQGGQVATSSTMTAADWQALNTAMNEPGGANYLQAMANNQQVAAATTGTVAASPTGTLADIVTSVLAPWGLDSPVIQSWVTSQITNLAAQNMSSAQIGEQIGIELQAPVGSSTDPATTAAQQAFSTMYPGMAIRKQNGLPPITVAQYQQLQDSYYQSASAVGISPSMLNSLAIGPDGKPGNAVGMLVGNDVSAQELTTRLQNGYNAAVNANPETVRLLQEYYPSVFPQGANGQAPSSGALLSYYLNPKNTVSTLENQITAAQIGTEGVNSQFGGITVGQAQKLQQAGVTQQTARDTFRTLAKLTPFETTLPGTRSVNDHMTQAQLIDYGFFGANQQLVENVQSARKAPFAGGGGYAATARGVVGAGSASEEGIQGT